MGANVFLKTEFRQFTGSFKERGARNAILQLMKTSGPDFVKKGVIAASAGNHALALAYHGKLLGIPVTVVMPTVAPLAKVDKCRVSHSIDFVYLVTPVENLYFLIQRLNTLNTEIRRTHHHRRRAYRRSQDLCRDLGDERGT